MKTIVVDASVAVKWVVQEEGSTAALALRRGHRLAAPDLLVAECSNILWKKVHRGELTRGEADVAAKLLQRADIVLMPMRDLMPAAVGLAIVLGHPAYDCLYLALARENNWTFVTADSRLVRKIHQHPDAAMHALIASIDAVSAP